MGKLTIKMKKSGLMLLVVGVLVWTTGCAGSYNTQAGAVLGAGVGALAGQAIGHDTESTLIGAAVGGVAGAVVGDAIDKQNQQNYGYYKYNTPSTTQLNYSSYNTGSNTSNGRWVYVPGQWVNGRWVPAHQVWVPNNTLRR